MLEQEWKVEDLGYFYRNTSQRFKIIQESTNIFSRLGQICLTAGETPEYLEYFHNLDTGIGLELFKVLEDHLSVHDLQSIATVFKKEYEKAEIERQMRIASHAANKASN